MDILIILAEVSFTILIFLMINWLVGKFFQLFINLSIFNGQERNIKTLRRNIKGLLILTCLVLCIFIVAADSFQIYRGENLQQYTLSLIHRIPPGFWVILGVGSAKSIGTLILAAIVVKFVQYWLKVANIRARRIEQSTADDENIDTFFENLKNIVISGIWLWAVIWCSKFLKVPVVISEYFYILIRIYLIIAVGLLILQATNAIINTLDVLSVRYSSPENLLRFYDRLRHLIPFMKRCLELVIYVCITTLVIQQIQLIANIAVFGAKTVKIVGIIFVSRVLFEVVYLLVEEVLFNDRHLTDTYRSRRLTLVPLIRSFLQYLVYFGASVSILYTLDINPTPILAGAGIVGVAVGFGSQTLVNDIVCGFFILFENYYLVGDYVQAGKAQDRTVEGIVEAIELRTTRLRHPNGQLQIIRNGDIGSITNYSKQYIFAVVEISVPYNSNLAHVYKVVEEVGEQLKVNDADVLEPTQVDGVESLGESSLLLRTLTKVKPGKHLHIQRILRKTFADALVQEGITIPLRIETTES
ncbi:MAG: mechanosensitive ion channel family protein [Rhizonema sp. NSF051]|nr:mechanosensitive ion channel family protein [Rhizonema sp. NSF051]